MNSNERFSNGIGKPRVLVLTNTYPTAAMPGDSPQIEDQVQSLRERGADVTVWYVDRYRGKRIYAETARKILPLSFRPQKYDLIHAYYGYCGFLARLQIKYPIVVTFLGSDLLYPKDAIIGKVAARLAEGVIVQSEEMKRIARRDDAQIIPFGVNTRQFTPRPREQCRRELGFASDEKLVLFPWNPARPVKRFDLVEAAIQILQQKYDQVKLVVVFDQPHEVVAKYMSACDVMALASNHEGSPMALREAMACNLPIVSVDVGDVHDLLIGVDGCYLCQRDPSDIAAKLDLVLQRGERTCSADLVRQADAAWGAEQVLKLYRSILTLHKKMAI